MNVLILLSDLDSYHSNRKYLFLNLPINRFCPLSVFLVFKWMGTFPPCLPTITESAILQMSTGARGTDHPPFSNFIFTNLFSIKFLYFFIISSLFPYFNLFVSIFIQYYVNIKLHVSTLYRY